MSDFFNTIAGREFQRNLGKIAKSLERIADALEEQNKNNQTEEADREQ